MSINIINYGGFLMENNKDNSYFSITVIVCFLVIIGLLSLDNTDDVTMYLKILIPATGILIIIVFLSWNCDYILFFYVRQSYKRNRYKII